jgi:hypothetical protein
MLLAYRDNPSFFAVARRLGVHHQTVQRCIERAESYGPLSALDDRPRPGKEPVHAAGQGLAGVFGVRQGQGPWLSARTVDDAAVGPPCARARTGGRTNDWFLYTKNHDEIHRHMENKCEQYSATEIAN